MALPDKDSAVAHSFGLEIDGIVIKHINKVTGLSMEQDVIELKENTPDGKYIIKKLPGRPKAGEIVLTRGLTEDQSFEKWVADVHGGQMDKGRKGGAVIIFDYEGKALKRYTMKGAWPSKLVINDPEAGGTSVLTETLTVTYEEMTVEAGG